MKQKPKCLNPSCGRILSGRYGARQKVCPRPECRSWYKAHWARTRQPPRGVPDDSFKRIVSATTDPAHRAFVVVARETGLRKGEILGLTWSDVLDSAGKTRGRVEVRGQWDDRRGFIETKTGESKVAYFTASARSALDALRAFLRRRRDRLGCLSTARIFRWSESGIYVWFITLQERIGIKNPETRLPYRIHDLRHSVGVELVRAGKIDLAREILGHRSIETTVSIYGRRSAEEILGEVEAVRRGRKW